MPATESPDWVQDALQRTAEEVRSFVATGATFIARPGKFACEWVAGRRRALNPLGVLATGAGVLFGLRPIDVSFGTRVLIRFHPLHASIWVD